MTDHTMAPDVSPGGLANLGQKPKGVKVLNRKPLGIALAFAGAILFIMMVVAMERADQGSDGTGTQQASRGNAANLADDILRQAPQSRFIRPTTPTLPIPDEPVKPPEPSRPLPLPNIAPQPAPEIRTPLDEMILRVEMSKLQLFDQAVKAQTTVQPRGNSRASTNSAASGLGGAPVVSSRELAANLADVRQRLGELTSCDPNAAYQERLNLARANVVASQYNDPTASGGAGGNEILLVQANAPDVLNQSSQTPDSGRWSLNTTMQAPNSPYEIRAGFVIPAVMTSGINSDLAGTIVARTAQNVYDTATGKHLMIPLGSTLVGTYSSNIVYGQERVLIAWQRIVFPDGQALDLGAMPGTDGAGYAGFAGEVNNHYLRIFGSAFLMSGIVAAVSMSQNNNNDDSGSNNQRAGDALSEALGQQLGNTMSQMISKNLNIASTITVRPGYRFNIIVIKDIPFNRPYKSFNYN